MKPARKLSLRREALGELASNELRGVGGGNATLDVGCVISTPTWCGLICNLTDRCAAIAPLTVEMECTTERCNLTAGCV